MREWMEEVDAHAGRNVVKILVACKNDLTQGRAVHTEEGKNVASSNGVRFFETSAKTN